ncbi:MAG TPA: peptidylprolyl isomerase, partial [Gemmatimonadales bacterium]|nr:peptidylprolyl isomerase [Gemmatimonadales bacterium]
LHLAVARAPRLVRGDRLVLPTGPVPDASVWAFEARAGETSPVIDAPGASYVFRVDSLEVGGVPPLAAVRGRVLRDARHEQQRVVARARSAEMARALAGAADLLAAARAQGYRGERLGPFSRATAGPELNANPIVLGAAFALKPGEKTPLIAGQTGFFVLQGIARTPADSGLWLKQRDRQRDALLQPIAQARVQQFLAALRAQANVVDRRAEVFHPSAASAS